MVAILSVFVPPIELVQSRVQGKRSHPTNTCKNHKIGRRQEWTAGLELLAEQPIRPGQTVGADKGYDVGAFVSECRGLGITPHVAVKHRHSRLDGRTTRHAGYAISQRRRKRVEDPFGWMKSYGLLRKLRHRGRENVAYRTPKKGPAVWQALLLASARDSSFHQGTEGIDSSDAMIA